MSDPTAWHRMRSLQVNHVCGVPPEFVTQGRRRW